MEKLNPRVIAFYLPQYHPIPENDRWWGRGFTEWTNVGKAKRYFWGHQQPKVPADLGYYDLRIPEVREEQAALAREAGIEGFCYWHYWFAGKQLLERPFNEVLQTGKPDFPFCLCWANHSWHAKFWNKDMPDKLLIEQTYPGKEDFINHFNAMLPAFKDRRYMLVDNKPIFGVFSPGEFKGTEEFISIWNKLAKENGFDGIYFVTISFKKSQNAHILKQGYNGIIYDLIFIRRSAIRFVYQLLHDVFHIPRIIDFRDYTKTLLNNMIIDKTILPCVIPNFDHTPRSGWRGTLLTHCNPDNWYKLMLALFRKLKDKNGEDNLVFVKSWNEWGEGNYLEPDLRYGKGFLEKLKKALSDSQRD
ncbi:MAG: glycoside hydrolase family 99-like domain-containing protein [Bacteroidales bacterium]|jgi:lipopolysaccharide biosynthesis protein